MKKENHVISIIGAGLSGLIAAKVLEDRGYSPVVYEAEERVGGRMKTDTIDGFKLDRGFQVMLTAYPKVREYLDFDALDLQYLKPGALIFRKGKKDRLGDPLRDFSAIIPTLFSDVGSFDDKLKVFKLNLTLRKKSVLEIFETEEKTTLAYLKEAGFSDKIIANFFRPFFSGIFLEPDLETSSRMFEFVFKMFSAGDAVIPAKGIEAIPQQLKRSLKRTKFYFNTKIKEVSDKAIFFENSDKINSDFTIVATDAATIIPNLRGQLTVWKSCQCFYFEVQEAVIKSPVIGLVADRDAFINNIFYHSSIKNGNTNPSDFISVTVVKQTELSFEDLKIRLEEELMEIFGIRIKKFITHYHIRKGLPDLAQLQYDMPYTETKLSSNIFLAGDHLLNASQNAAMLSGEKAAFAVLKAIEG